LRDRTARVLAGGVDGSNALYLGGVGRSDVPYGGGAQVVAAVSGKFILRRRAWKRGSARRGAKNCPIVGRQIQSGPPLCRI